MARDFTNFDAGCHGPVPVLVKNSIRLPRASFDDAFVISERHLRRLLRHHLAYYNATRPHQSLHNDSARDRGGCVRAVCRGEGEVRGPKEVSGGSVRLLLFRREATGLRGGPRVGSKS